MWDSVWKKGFAFLRKKNHYPRPYSLYIRINLLLHCPLSSGSELYEGTMGGNANQRTTPTDVLVCYRLAGNTSAFTQRRWWGEQASWHSAPPCITWLPPHPSLIIIHRICIALDNFQSTFTDFILFDPLESLWRPPGQGLLFTFYRLRRLSRPFNHPSLWRAC